MITQHRNDDRNNVEILHRIRKNMRKISININGCRWVNANDDGDGDDYGGAVGSGDRGCEAERMIAAGRGDDSGNDGVDDGCEADSNDDDDDVTVVVVVVMVLMVMVIVKGLMGKMVWQQ